MLIPLGRPFCSPIYYIQILINNTAQQLFATNKVFVVSCITQGPEFKSDSHFSVITNFKEIRTKSGIPDFLRGRVQRKFNIK